MAPSFAQAVRTYRVVNVPLGDYLNVRQGPGSNYPVVLKLPPGAGGIRFETTRYANAETMWQEISVFGTRGYVNELYLEIEPLVLSE